MTVGIYCYIDKKDGSIVYIGKDSHIDKNRRHREHCTPSKYKEQQINKVIQNNPDRYKYKILKSWEPLEYAEKLDSALEIIFIRRYNPKFNYTIGGEGFRGFTLSKEARKRIGDAHRGKVLSEKTKEKLRQSHLGKTHSEETKLKISKIVKGRKYPQKFKDDCSQRQTTTGFFRVHKKKDLTCTQGFIWAYQYYDDNLKRQSIKRVDLFKLKKAVEAMNFVWKIVDIDMACETVKDIVSV